MPQTTREEVCLRGYGPLLSRVPFLSGINHSFLKELSINTSLYLFAPGDIILYGGDMGRAMYCIRKGHVEVSALHIMQSPPGLLILFTGVVRRFIPCCEIAGSGWTLWRRWFPVWRSSRVHSTCCHTLSGILTPLHHDIIVTSQFYQISASHDEVERRE